MLHLIIVHVIVLGIYWVISKPVKLLKYGIWQRCFHFSFRSRYIEKEVTLHHMFCLRLFPKSYIKISTFQPNFLCSSSFNIKVK